MTYLLDTNTVIRYINGRTPRILENMRQIPDSEIAVCSVTKGELFTGSFKSKQPEISRAKQDAFLVRFASIPYDDRAANEFGRIRAKLEQSGVPIGPYDLQIAAIALVHGLIVVTHNTKEFVRITGLKTVDWEL